MYSGKPRKLLHERNIRVGDRIAVEKNGIRYEGTLMPRPEIGDAACIVIKLDNGYNIGIDCRNVRISKLTDEKNGREGVATGTFRMNKKNPQVSIVTTGGTITSKIDYKTGGVTSLTTPDDLQRKIPRLGKFAKIRIENPFNIMSESMTPSHWQNLAKVVARELRKSEGVIVTHGTDTLHFTAAALSFMLRDLNKPVVLTGSQRSTDRGSSDGFSNIICSARVALSDMAAVGICMHANMDDDYCIFTRGTKVRKMHTSRRDAFRPINDIPLAKVWPDGKIEKLQGVPPRKKGAVKLETSFEPKVALVKFYPGCNPEIIDYYLKKGYKGLVVEVTGLGQLPTYGKNSWIDTIKRATERGMLIFGAAETIYGRLNPNVYTEGRLTKEAGLIHLQDMLPETAYVKLGWVLGQTKKPEKVAERMLTNYAGEMRDRTVMGTFLV
ncbi:MAG: Glu-tRNA(Gln) amidotransferase subunit GatD [Candidatus Aenigmatarchaeota archaeon]|nr:MAG: Glu-tRNA(Gln) amidotransferase subunit GatD [Candidatus Aenigmarchaeota archaeon]